MNSKNFFLLITSVLFAILICEVFLRLYPSILSDKLIFKLPYGKVRDDIFKRVFKIDKEKIDYLIYEKDKKIPLYQNNIDWKSNTKDLEWGAESIAYYNSGFCEPEISDLILNSKDTNGIAVGDSFTYCFSLSPEQSWPYKLGNLNNKINNKVYNLGIKGQGPYQYYYILKKYINKNTKYVFIGWYEGNDLRDIIKYLNSNYKKDSKKFKDLINKKSKNKNNLRKSITSHLRNNYYIINLVYAVGVGEIYKKIFGFDTNEERITNLQYSYKNQNREVKFNIENSDTDEVFHANLVAQMEDSENFLYEKYYFPLYKISQLAKSHKTKTYLVYIPSAYNAFGKNIIFEEKDHTQKLIDFSTLQRKTLKKISDELNFLFVDTSQDIINFNNLNPEILTHFPANVHLTENGHDVISKSILNNLE